MIRLQQAFLFVEKKYLAIYVPIPAHHFSILTGIT